MNNDSLKGKSLLIVDDEADLREIISMEMGYFGAKVYQAESVQKALEILSQYHIDLIISDIRMPGCTGVDLLKQVREKHPHFPAMMLITGFADIDTSEALALGAEALIHKPFDMDELLNSVSHFMKKFPERFQRKMSCEHSLNFTFRGDLADELNTSVFWGRGGVKIVHPEQPVPLGSLRKVEFHFRDQVLVFEGIIRWKKTLADKIYLGVEFICLDDKLLEIIGNVQDSIPYIPS